jgi:hypothetical protein
VIYRPAGTAAELRIAIFGSIEINGDPTGLAVIDAISFSPEPIPEPAVGWLIALVGAMLVRSRR